MSGFQIMSAQAKYTQFLLQLADLGCALQLPQLRDSARALLNIMPADQFTGGYKDLGSDRFWQMSYDSWMCTLTSVRELST